MNASHHLRLVIRQGAVIRQPLAVMLNDQKQGDQSGGEGEEPEDVIAVAQDGRHRTAGREAGDEHLARGDPVARHHRAGHARQQRGLAAPAALMVVLEPVPAALRIDVRGLGRIEHEETPLARELVHARAGGEIVGVLRAAVKHHDKRRR